MDVVDGSLRQIWTQSDFDVSMFGSQDEELVWGSILCFFGFFFCSCLLVKVSFSFSSSFGQIFLVIVYPNIASISEPLGLVRIGFETAHMVFPGVYLPRRGIFQVCLGLRPIRVLFRCENKCPDDQYGR